MTDCFPLVELSHASVSYAECLALQDVTFSVYPGQNWVVLGPNGSGKSTLLKVLSGEARVTAENQRPPGASEEQGSCLWCFEGEQEPYVLSARTHTRIVSPAVQENYHRQGWNVTGLETILASIGNSALLYGKVEDGQIGAARNLARQAGAEHLLELPVPAMSQGQLRLVLILRAVFCRPKLLLLDEPFDGLDAESRKTALELIRLAVSQGSTYVITAHREKDIPPDILHALRLERGRATIMTAAELVEAKGGAGVFFPGQKLSEKPQRMPEVQKDGGGEKSALQPDGRNTAIHSGLLSDPGLGWAGALPPELSGRPTFKLENVDVYIDRLQALYDINWTVMPGEQWIITGGNGAGKSTILRLLYGDEFAAFGGSLSWFGRENMPLAELRRLVGYVSDRLQQRYSYDLNGLDLVLSGFYGTIGLYHTPSAAEREGAAGLLRLLELEEYADVPLSALSSGLGRRFLLARSLVAKPAALLLDEPCSGLDGPSREQFLASLPVLDKAGVRMVYVSHHHEDIPDFFSHELALKEGRVVYCGPRR